MVRGNPAIASVAVESARANAVYILHTELNLTAVTASRSNDSIPDFLL